MTLEEIFLLLLFAAMGLTVALIIEELRVAAKHDKWLQEFLKKMKDIK